MIYLIILITGLNPIFKQKRLGKNKKAFDIYKFRTMVENAEMLKPKIKHLNEADGPVFKIYDDPRYTKIGKWLSRLGLDEIPQLINIIKGEMAFVGPRPLPIDEGKKVPKKYEARFSVLPGITSLWVVKGAYHNDFQRWMRDDLEYVKKKSFFYDCYIIIKTIFFIIKLLIKNIFFYGKN